MIVNTGKLKLLTLQLTGIAAYQWALFTSNTTISAATVWADLTEAAFTGYARVSVGTLNTAAIVGGRASTTPVVAPVFTNGSGGGVTIYGWALIETAGPTLIAATNLGSTTIPAGQSYSLAGTITDTQE